MSTRLRGRRSGPFWTLMIFLLFTVLVIGYLVAVRQPDNPLSSLWATTDPAPTPTAGPAATAAVVVALATPAETPAAGPMPIPTATETATADLMAAHMATAVAVTLTALPTATTPPRPTATATVLDLGATATAHAAAVAAQPATVASAGLRLRSGPGTLYDVLRELGSGSEVTVLGRLADGSWLQVAAQDGVTGWVAAEFVFLYDERHPADLRYIVAHELTHLFTWNTFGAPSSVMLSEGIAVYTGMTWIAGERHLPLAHFCAAYAAAGVLPRVATELAFRGHIRDLANYYAAGCFVQFLIERYGIESFARLYPTSNYVGIYDKSLAELEAEWRATIAENSVTLPFAPTELVTAVEQVARAYTELLTGFRGTEDEMSDYQRLEEARIALLEGRLEFVWAFFQPQ